MNIHRWLPFIMFITSFIAVIEVYVLVHWTKFVKTKSWNKYYYLVPWIISAAVLLVSLFLNINRIYSSDVIIKYNVLLLLTSFWYLPKLLIIPFLLFKDITKLFKYIIFSIRNKKNNSIEENKIKETDTKKRDTISTIGWTMAAVPFGIAGYGILKTSNEIAVHQVNLRLPKFPVNLENFKIVQISDIHAGSYLSKNLFRKVRQTVNMLNPDVVVITGDFVNFRTAELAVIEDELSLIESKYGVYGCMGNHDHYVDNVEEFIERLRSSGIEMLINSNHTIDTKMGIVQIAGVDNTGMSNQDFADFDKAIDGLDQTNSIIMLCHDPTNWDKSIVGLRNIDLTLAGHTHGGQFAFNIFGKTFSPAGFVYKQWEGLYHSKSQYLYVNRGVGMTGPPMRVGVNPEVTLFRLNHDNSLV